MSITEKEKAMRTLFSRRLSELITSRDLQQKELADIIGVNESSVGKWLLCKAMPRMGTVQKLADYFGVPKSYFLEENKITTDPSDAEPGSFWYRYIPYAVSAGWFDDCAPLDSLPLISIPDVLLGKYARDPRLVMMHVNGESMNRVIENGATIAVLTDVPRASLQNGDIVIACHDGEGYTVKRFYDLPEDHQIILSPDSNDPSFLPIPIPYDTTDDLHIFGKVVMYSVIL